MPHRIVHVLIRGQVQGVGFRAWTQHQAELHGLKGWVRNRRDGTVEAVFSGPEAAVEAVLHACREGPSTGHVSDIRVTSVDDPATAGSGGFEVRATV